MDWQEEDGLHFVPWQELLRILPIWKYPAERTVEGGTTLKESPLFLSVLQMLALWVSAGLVLPSGSPTP